MNAKELQEILELHKKWLNNEEGGKRADLRNADLRNADLRYADLSYADLHNADLHNADLHNANIYNTTGDGMFIRSMQLPKYIVNICDDWLQIGCRGYRVHKWAEFTDAEISKMDHNALEWWNEYRDLVFTFAGWKEYVK